MKPKVIHSAHVYTMLKDPFNSFFFLYSESLDVKLLQNQRYKALGNLFKQRPILYKEALLMSVQQLAGTCLGQLPGDGSIAAGYFQ